MTGLELWWLGQSGFRLRDPAGGPVVFVDPFLSAHQDRTWEAPISPEAMGRQADLILCTHQHLDHFDQPALRAAAASAGRALPPGGAAAARRAGGEPRRSARPCGRRPAGPAAHAGRRVRQPGAARHGVDVSDAYTFGEQLSHGLVRYLGYVIELGGVRAYHAGDCIPYTGQAETVGALRPDLALLPINGRDFYRETERNIVGNMDVREAARLAVRLRRPGPDPHALGAISLQPGLSR